MNDDVSGVNAVAWLTDHLCAAGSPLKLCFGSNNHFNNKCYCFINVASNVFRT